MTINLTDKIPVCQISLRLSFTEKLEVGKQIDGWLKQGVICKIVQIVVRLFWCVE